jgi:hypothetical protein
MSDTKLEPATEILATKIDARFSLEDGKEETRSLVFKSTRLKRGKAKELKKQAAFHDYIEYQKENFDPVNMKFKTVDLKGFLEAHDKVEEQLTVLLWGIPGDLGVEALVDEDYQKMVATVRDADPIGLEKDKATAKKKEEETSELETAQKRIAQLEAEIASLPGSKNG